MSKASLKNSFLSTIILALCLLPSAAKAESQVYEGKRQEYVTHIVKWYEDLSSIASQYGMSAQTIMVYNGMTQPTVTRKQVLKIPLYPEKVVIPADFTAAPAVAPAPAAEKIAAEKIAGTTEEPSDAAVPSAPTLLPPPSPVGEVRVCFALPLMNGGKINDSNYDFYSGALLAARMMAEGGISIDLDVLDVNSPDPMLPYRMNGCDFVIGPASTAEIDATMQRCSDSLAFISPLDARAGVLADSHGNFIQAPSPVDAQYADVIDWVREEYLPGDKVYLFTEKGSSPSALATHLASSGIIYETVTYGILEGRTIPDKLDQGMTQHGTNRVLIASESEAFVNDVVRNMNLMVHRKFDVVVYSASKIRNFETIDAESCHNVSMRVSSSYFVDYDKSEVKSFLLAYRALFGTEPGPFAFQGYDTMKCFSTLTAAYGKAWKSKLCQQKVQGLQSDFLFVKKENGGYVNNAIRRIIYDPDFSVRVKLQ